MRWRLMVSNDEHEKLIAQLKASRDKVEELKDALAKDFNKAVERLLEPLRKQLQASQADVERKDIALQSIYGRHESRCRNKLGWDRITRDTAEQALTPDQKRQKECEICDDETVVPAEDGITPDEDGEFYKPCPKCTDDQKRQQVLKPKCKTCGGSGKVTCKKCLGMGWYQINYKTNDKSSCERCNSRGKVPCPKCTDDQKRQAIFKEKE